MNTAMHGLAPAAATRETSLHRAAAMLRACASPLARRLCCAAAALLVAVAVLLAIIAPRPERGALAAVLFTAWAVAVPWGFWFPRLLLLRLEARASRMPALAATIPTALALLLLATVVVPAAALVLLAGTEPVFTVSVLMLAAMAALLLAMLPSWCYLALCFAPLVLALPLLMARRWLGPDALQLDAAAFDPRHLPWFAALLSLLAIWRWRGIVRAAGTPPSSPWRQPVVLSGRVGQLWGGFGLMDANQWQAAMPDWLWPAGQTGAAGGRVRPVEAIRVILGTPFAPLSCRQILVQLGFMALALLVSVMAFGSDPDSPQMRSLINGGLGGGLGGGGMVLVCMYGWRLDLLRRRPAGELAELALLPGWGDAARARRLLLLAVAKPLMQAGGLGLLVLLGLGAAAGLAATGLAWLLVAAIGLCLLAAFACLRPLSGQAMLSAWMSGLLLAAMAMLIATVAVATRPDWSGAGAWLAGGWLLVYAACGIGLATSWRRFRARPHPFVQ